MNTRIFSWFVPIIVFAITAVSTAGLCTLQAQDKAPNESGQRYFTDPSTGIVYQKVIRTIERPVVETRIQKQEQTVFRPETVTETVPQASTVFVPQTEYTWQPVLHGRWNPFRQPTITYHHVPRTQWKQSTDVATRTQTRTNWVAEKRTVEVPQSVASIKREEKVDYVAIGRVAPPNQSTPQSNVSSAIASRLRPIEPNTRIQTIDQQRISGTLAAQPRIPTPIPYRGPYVAQGNTWTRRGAPVGPGGFAQAANTRVASSVGRMTSDPPRRGVDQSGIRATELYPVTRGISQPLPPSSGGSGIANLPGWSLWR